MRLIDVVLICIDIFVNLVAWNVYGSVSVNCKWNPSSLDGDICHEFMSLMVSLRMEILTPSTEGLVGESVADLMEFAIHP